MGQKWGHRSNFIQPEVLVWAGEKAVASPEGCSGTECILRFTISWQIPRLAVHGDRPACTTFCCPARSLAARPRCFLTLGSDVTSDKDIDGNRGRVWHVPSGNQLFITKVLGWGGSACETHMEIITSLVQ